MIPKPPLSLPLAALQALAVPVFALPVAAHAQGTEEQQQACTPDAVKLCSDTIPDIGKTTACMKAHFSQLTPRCQAAFNDATGGDKTKSAARKAEPRARVVAKAERRMPPLRAERAPAASNTAEPAPPPSADVGPATPPQLAGFPPYPSPETSPVHAPTSPRSQIAQACREGLIDSFTCSNTVPALLGASGY